jgi:hypothetical protein
MFIISLPNLKLIDRTDLRQVPAQEDLPLVLVITMPALMLTIMKDQNHQIIIEQVQLQHSLKILKTYHQSIKVLEVLLP